MHCLCLLFLNENMFSVFYANTHKLVFVQISTQPGWLRPSMLTSWWSPGRGRVTSCPQTAPFTNTPWTSRGFNFLDLSHSTPTMTTPSGACHGPMKIRWPASGTWTGRRPKCGGVGDWSAPLTLWFTKPSDRWWTGILPAKERNRQGDRAKTSFHRMSQKCVKLELNMLVCGWRKMFTPLNLLQL